MAPLNRVGGADRAWLGVLAVAVLFLATQQLHVLSAPFLLDDYIFLDKGRTASFGSLWGAERLTLGWYRPWSRELHFWALQRLAGSRVAWWHLTSFTLWIGIIAAYWALVRRAAGERVARVATAGVMALSAWAVTLFWVAGAQDLWMLLLGLLALLAFARGWTVAACVLLGLALLSKETAVAWPAVAFAWSWSIERRTPRAALVRVLPLLGVVIVWALVHPALLGRFWLGPTTAPSIPGLHPSLGTIALRTPAMLVNLDAAPAPASGWRAALLRALPAIGMLSAWLLLLARRPKEPREPAEPGRLRPVLAFGVCWALAGWAPLLLPRIGWHGYYALLGALGAWIVLGSALARRPAIAALLVAGMLVLRAAQVDTLTQDWGTERYQRRAADFMQYMKEDLRRRYPEFPPHSRLYFAAVPSHVGFMTDDGPALREWYADPTLRGGFYRDYAPRPATAVRGSDFFFRYDSTAGWVEVRAGDEDVATARAANPRWEQDHRELAGTFANTGEWRAAAQEYDKIALARPDDPEAALDAGVCHEMAGDTTSAVRWYERAAALPGASAEARRFAERLRATRRR